MTGPHWRDTKEQSAPGASKTFYQHRGTVRPFLGTKRKTPPTGSTLFWPEATPILWGGECGAWGLPGGGGVGVGLAQAAQDGRAARRSSRPPAESERTRATGSGQGTHVSHPLERVRRCSHRPASSSVHPGAMAEPLPWPGRLPRGPRPLLKGLLLLSPHFPCGE